jgi:hypothetical protein
MRSWNRWAAIFYMVVGIAFFYLGVSGPRTDALRIALGVVFVALGAWRYQRYRRADAAGPVAPPGGPPRA